MNYSSLIPVIFGAMLLNGALGCILFAAWRLVRLALANRTDIPITYMILRMIILCLVIPIGGALEVYHWLHNGCLFVLVDLLSEDQMTLISLAGVLWMAGTLALVARHMVYRVEYGRLAAKNSTPASLRWIRRLEVLSREMGVGRKVVCRERYGDESAFVMGVFCPVIYVPVQECTDQEIDAILTHELNHVLEYDLLWKSLADLVCCIYWPLTPVWRRLCGDVQNWSEFNCDYLSCVRLGSAREYFRIIERFMGGVHGRYACGWAAGLGLSEKELIARMRTMVTQQRLSRFRIRWILALMAAFMMAGSTSVMAASYSSVREYRDLYWGNLEVILEDGRADTAERLDTHPVLLREKGWEEHAILMGEYGAADGSVEGFTFPDEDSSILFGWNMEVGQICISEPILIPADGTIVVGAAPEADGCSVRVGLVYPDGTAHYVVTEGDVINTYRTGQGGPYRVFAENTSHGKVIIGGYILNQEEE